MSKPSKTVVRASLPTTTTMTTTTTTSTSQTATLGSLLRHYFLRRSSSSARTWKPPALQPWVLTVTTLLCWGLIISLQILLTKSQRDQGIIFAPRINDLSLTLTFPVLYLPTIVAVIYSIFWAWIDLETKRLEPYYQLSKERGALGKDSLLLHYPFDFIPLVPIKAFRHRHWPVFWASTAVVLVTWGLVPTQAGIFSTGTVTRTFPTSFAVSKSFMAATDQRTTLSLKYSQSAYGIVNLNETLPSYMTRNYTLAPFISLDDDVQHTGRWTAQTTLYSLDIECEEATQSSGSTLSTPRSFNSTTGCHFMGGQSGNNTIGEAFPETESAQYLDMKEFSAMYVGYSNDNGFADYYLSDYCPPKANHTFYASFTRNKKVATDPPGKVTALFCEPKYFEQDVNATVDILSKAPLSVAPISAKRALSQDVFNTSYFESVMNSAAALVEVRGDRLPGLALPKYLDRLASTNLSFVSERGGGIIQPMAAMAAFAGDRPLQDYLDPKTLGESYESAYRLLFARAMVEVLAANFSSSTSTNISGQRHITSEAVILEPVFTYLVEGLMGLVSICTLAILYLGAFRQRKLRFNPSTITSVMSLVADNPSLLAEFEDLDCCTMEKIEQVLKEKRFKLVDNENSHGIVEIQQQQNLTLTNTSSTLTPGSGRKNSQRDISKPVRPNEFRLLFALPFTTLFLVLAIGLAILFFKGRVNGLPLPSRNKIVQNLVENYLPTAIATLIEPMWILINRLLCMLQPLEELQDCKAKAKNSIGLDYSSLPPQLTLFKALLSKHYVLATVCAMALLANLLAAAFAGLFFQDTRQRSTAAVFWPPYEARFVSLNGSVGPTNGLIFGSQNISGAYRGGVGDEQFLIAESNYTRNSSLPAWTDDMWMYVPFMNAKDQDEDSTLQYRARTKAFGADLECKALQFGIDYEASLGPDESGNLHALFRTTVVGKTGRNITCSSLSPQILPGPSDNETATGIKSTCQRGRTALEFLFIPESDRNSTQEDKEACMATVALGWMRDPVGTCGNITRRDLDGSNSFFVGCRPRIRVGEAVLLVDSRGNLKKRVDEVEQAKASSAADFETYFENDSINLLAQSSQFLFIDQQPTWHNDSFASDYLNHFIIRASNSSRLVDPGMNVPTFSDVDGPLRKAYAKLFAIWLGTNKENLLVPLKEKISVSGTEVRDDTRLFLSTPLFAISEGVLSIYAMVAVLVYVRRPGQYLARMPTCIASIIALFAASAAVQDLRGTSQCGGNERAQYLDKLNLRYGYGSFVGADGRVHIGIEKTPFVRRRKTSTWLDRKTISFGTFRKR